MAGDEVSGKNVEDGDANNRNDVHTSCTNSVSENTHGHLHWCLLDTIACSSTVSCRSQTGLVDQLEGHTLMVRGLWILGRAYNRGMCPAEQRRRS